MGGQGRGRPGQGGAGGLSCPARTRAKRAAQKGEVDDKLCGGGKAGGEGWGDRACMGRGGGR